MRLPSTRRAAGGAPLRVLSVQLLEDHGLQLLIVDPVGVEGRRLELRVPADRDLARLSGRERQRLAVGTDRLQDQHRHALTLSPAAWEDPAMAKEAITIEAAGREVRLSSPSKVYFPEPGHTKLDLAEYYLAVADAACLHLRERPTTMKRFVEGVDRRVLLPEAGAEERARLARDGDRQVPQRPQRHRAGRQRRRPPRLGGQPRGDRLQPLAGPPRRPRPPRRAAGRPRPDAGVELRRGARRWRWSSARRSPTTACSASRRPRARAGSTSTCGSSRSGTSPRCAGRRWRWRARSSGAPSWRPRSGGRRSATASSSTTTRTPATAPSPRPGRCARSRTPASRRRSSGTRSPDVDPAELRLDTVPARLAERGDPSATIDDVAHSLDSLLELADRDEAEGLGDAPGRRTSASRRTSRSASSRAGRRSPHISRHAAGLGFVLGLRLTRVRYDSSCSKRHSRGGLVVAPAQDLGAVADAAGADVVEADLEHQLGPQRDPLEVTVGRPAAGVGGAALAGLIGRQRVDQLALLLRLQARGVADDAQLALAVVEAEDQRADRALLLARAPADDDGVDRPQALDLDHPLALARQVRGVEALGDHALAALQPRLGLGGGPRPAASARPCPGRRSRRPASRAPRGAARTGSRTALWSPTASRSKRETAPASSRRASSPATPPGGGGSEARRRPRGRRRRGSAARRRSRSGPRGTRARGSSGPAACRFATAGRARRRRRRQARESRRTWARRPSPRRWEAACARARAGA